MALPSEERAPSAVVVAAFDFDGTITRGGSVFPFLVAARGLLPVLATTARSAPALLRAAIWGGSRADEAKEALFARLLVGIPEERLARVGAAFAERHLRRKVRPEVRARLEWHRQQGHRVLVVSASPELYVRAAGEILGADDVLATRLAVGGGLLTGRYEGQNCRGAEKYARVTAWLRASGLAGNGMPQPVLWAYGNARGDLRLLQAADVGVNAGRLGRLGRLRSFTPLSLAHQVGTPPAPLSD